MDIKNIAIVRATNVIPFDGIVRPVSEVPYLEPEKGSGLSFGINDLLRKQGKLKEMDWSKPETERNEIDKQNNEILKQYMPYNSNYNSMVLWALNGIVPDDNSAGGTFGTNIFSNKDCAIIDGLEEQLDQSEIVSLVPTDTAIKGNVKLSNQAIILLSKERYESLSQEEKDKLSSLDLKLEIFEGDLTETVNKTLQKSGRYTAETLSLRREDDGYIKSDTSDEVRKIVCDIANERSIAQVLHYNVITGQNDELDKLVDVKDEFKNGLIVSEFYKKTFFEYLFSKMEISDRVKADVMYMPDSSVYIEQLCSEIEKIGIDEYKKVVDTYNHSLEQLKQSGNLPTPQQIVDSVRGNKKIDLISMIEELEKQSEENCRNVGIGEIKEVAEGATKTSRDGTINAIAKSKEEKIKEGPSHNEE